MKKVCIIGYPAKHSLSPAIHDYWLKKYGIKGRYEIRETLPENFDNFFKNLQQEGYVGCNVTVPFKERAFELVNDMLEREAGGFEHNPEGIVAYISGAVNTVNIENEKYIGKNTDGKGFIANIINTKPKNLRLHGKVVILGAGGAARAAITVFMVGNFAEEIVVINRSKDRAINIINDLNKYKDTFFNKWKGKINIVDWEKREEALSGANLLVNTTSLGMVGEPPLDIDLSLLPKDALVTDIVYRPLITPLLQAAKDRGNPIVDGLGMLLYQAVPGFEMWFAEELAELKKKDPNFKGIEVTPELRAKIESLL